MLRASLLLLLIFPAACAVAGTRSCLVNDYIVFRYVCALTPTWWPSLFNTVPTSMQRTWTGKLPGTWLLKTSLVRQLTFCGRPVLTVCSCRLVSFTKYLRCLMVGTSSTGLRRSRLSTHRAGDQVGRAGSRFSGYKPQSLDNWQQVEHLYRQALAIDPGNVKAMMGLASALSFQASNFGFELSTGAREKTWNEAIDLATRAAGSEPDSPEYFRVVAFYAANHGDVEGERRAAEAMLRLDPRNPSAYNVLARTFMRAGEPQRAIELLTKAVDLDRKNADAVFLNNLGHAYFMAGNNKAAIEWCDKALQIEPTFDSAHIILAMAFALDGNEARAHAEAVEVRRLNPNFRFDLEKARARSESPAYRRYLEERVVPALKRAGLSE